VEGFDGFRELDGRKLTAQVRNIAEVTTAVANGDLSRKITVDVRGEILELKNTINVMVDQLNAFAGEVTAWPAKSNGRKTGRPGGSEGRGGGRTHRVGNCLAMVNLPVQVTHAAHAFTSPGRPVSFRSDFAATGHFARERINWSTMTLMVFFNSKISPRTSTVILRLKSR